MVSSGFHCVFWQVHFGITLWNGLRIWGDSIGMKHEGEKWLSNGAQVCCEIKMENVALKGHLCVSGIGLSSATGFKPLKWHSDYKNVLMERVCIARGRGIGAVDKSLQQPFRSVYRHRWDCVGLFISSRISPNLLPYGLFRQKTVLFPQPNSFILWVFVLAPKLCSLPAVMHREFCKDKHIYDLLCGVQTRLCSTPRTDSRWLMWENNDGKAERQRRRRFLHFGGERANNATAGTISARSL